MTDKSELERIIHEMDVDHSTWHLDKKVPIALIVTIALQTLAAAWIAGQLINRVEHLEVAVADHANQLRTNSLERNINSRTIAVLKESQKHIDKQLDEMDTKLDKLLGR